MMNSFYNKKRRAFSLMEIAIVLGVVSVLIAGVWSASGNVNAVHKTTKATQQVMQIVTGFKSLYATSGVDTAAGVTHDLTCAGIASQIIPLEMIPAGAGACVENASGSADPPDIPSFYPQSPWFQNVTVRGDRTNNGLIIDYFNLTADACISFATAQANNPGIIQSWVGPSAATTNKQYAPLGTSAPMTVSNITGYCSGSSNNVSFEYSIK